VKITKDHYHNKMVAELQAICKEKCIKGMTQAPKRMLVMNCDEAPGNVYGAWTSVLERRRDSGKTKALGWEGRRRTRGWR
jgi:hypothetical protein